MGIVLVLVWLIGWLRLEEEGGRKFCGGGVVWCVVWCVVEWRVVWVRKKIRCDGLLLLLLCSE